MTEQQFEKMIREHKGTIYTVCYMFSNDPDEVADLFQETLINLWRGSGTFRGDRAIVLLWLENLSYEEIGQIVGISTKNVSVRLVRIKEQLKKMQ
ncbi:MAG: sigma-70 family RNA polymerase sigma factor [Bacteroidales bacterium]|nr:sigma-70 family RNA polymerase sigma factor [Bacteroidales bacterium]